jgi:hypothetical protein
MFRGAARAGQAPPVGFLPAGMPSPGPLCGWTDLRPARFPPYSARLSAPPGDLDRPRAFAAVANLSWTHSWRRCTDAAVAAVAHHIPQLLDSIETQLNLAIITRSEGLGRPPPGGPRWLPQLGLAGRQSPSMRTPRGEVVRARWGRSAIGCSLTQPFAADDVAVRVCCTDSVCVRRRKLDLNHLDVGDQVRGQDSAGQHRCVRIVSHEMAASAMSRAP